MLSAQRGDGVDRLLDLVDQVAKEHRRRIPTAQLNRFFAEVIEEMPPPLHHGRAVSIHYITQAAIRPPTFILWANKPEGLAPSYKRFIANRLRQALRLPRHADPDLRQGAQGPSQRQAERRSEVAPADRAAHAEREHRDVAAERREPALEAPRARAARRGRRGRRRRRARSRRRSSIGPPPVTTPPTPPNAYGTYLSTSKRNDDADVARARRTTSRSRPRCRRRRTGRRRARRAARNRCRSRARRSPPARRRRRA